MTAPTAPALGPSAPSVAPETLLDGTNRTSDVTVMKWLIRARHADLAHPGVRRWVVPLLCAGIGIPAARDAANGIGPAVPTVLALIVAFCVPLLWRQQRPVLVFALTSAVSSVALALDAATGSEAARIVALLNVGRNVRPAQLAVCLAIAVAQTSLSVVVRGAEQPNEQFLQTPVLAIVQSALVAAVAAAGLVGRVVNAYIRALHERAVRLEVERDQRARLAAAAERARVAREMHDILGHTLAVIVGLAGGAAGLTETKPKRGAETLRIIADSGRGALAELRRLLAVIGEERDTSEDPPTPGTEPTRGPAPRPSAGPGRPRPPPGTRPRRRPHRHPAHTGRPHRPGPRPPTGRLPRGPGVPDEHPQTRRGRHDGPHHPDDPRHVRTRQRSRTRALPAPHAPPPRRTRAAACSACANARRCTGGSVTAGPTPQGGWTVEAHFRTTTTPPPPHTAPTEKRPA